MKTKTKIAILAPLIGAACMQDGGLGSDGTQHSEKVSNGFHPSERLLVQTDDLRPEDFRSRVGKLQDGSYYEYFSDTSGAITTTPADGPGIAKAIWRFVCYNDKMEGGSNCTIRGFSQFDEITSVPTVLLESRNARFPNRLCVSYHDFPGRVARIRINNGQPISLGTNGCTKSAGLIKSFVSAQTVVVEGVEWPYDSKKQREVDMRGMPEAIEIISFSMKLDSI